MYWLAVVAALARLPQQNPTDLSAALQRSISAPAHATMRWGNVSDISASLKHVYTDANWRPLWLQNGQLSTAGQQLLVKLLQAREFGLDPEDYDATRLTHDRPLLASATSAMQGDYDLALSAAALRYTLALHRGRVDPRWWHPLLRMRTDSLNATATLSALAAGANLDSLARAVQPQHPAYWRLIDLLKISRADSGAHTMAAADFPTKLLPGGGLRAAPQLRALLIRLGALPASALASDTLYDSTLVSGVKSFQKDQGLAADGVIGPGTRSALLLPQRQRIRQIELTLERWRWLPIPPDQRLVAVNIPAMRLQAVNPTPDGIKSLEMDVVVGKVQGFQTPMLSTVVSGIQVLPSWIVPASIARDEIRPKALADPTMMTKDRYQIVRGDSVLPPTAENIRRLGAGVELRQLPGPRNALAQMKLQMANPANIYLHDSPERAFFAQPLRAFSHGCVRLADAKALGRFLLTGNTRLADAEWNAQLMGKSSVLIPLAQPELILLVYHTVAVAEDGRPAYFSDLYQLDPSLDAALHRGYPYPPYLLMPGKKPSAFP